LLSAVSRFKQLSAAEGSVEAFLRGVELHDASAEAARQMLKNEGIESDITTADFLTLPPEPVHDAVIGNPPFVRYQRFTGSSRAKGLEVALAQGVRLSLLANSWAPFVVHAAQFLKPTGRLGLVLPAELLSVNYAAPVRRFLLNRFASIKLVMFEELVFPDVLEEVVLLLAEGTGQSAGFEVYQARNIADLDFQESSWTQFTPHGVDKWTSALVASESLSVYRSVLENERVNTLLDWGESYLGAVTGNNKYFTLTAQQVVDHQLSRPELLPISPPGSRHLRGLSFTQRGWSDLAKGANEWQGILKDAEYMMFHLLSYQNVLGLKIDLMNWIIQENLWNEEEQWKTLLSFLY